jgi:transketolase
MRDHFIKRLHEIAVRDPRIVLITGDLGFGVFNQFRKELEHQFINAGVSEQNMTMLATGMAMEGRIAFTYSIGNFPTLRCLEMIRNDAAYHDTNVKVVSIGGGFSYGALGISHHATEDLAIMRSLPEVKVLSPCTLLETIEATEAIVNTPGTCYLRLDKSSGEEVCSQSVPFQLGKLRVLRDGNVAVIVTGGILSEVQKAAKILADEGIELKIISCHTIKPFDVDGLIEATKDSCAVVSVEEHTVFGGLGSIIAETFMDHGIIPNRFLRIGLEAGFSSIVGSQEYLRTRYGLDSNAIASKIRNLMNRKSLREI